jgi:hypothetical protein
MQLHKNIFTNDEVEIINNIINDLILKNEIIKMSDQIEFKPEAKKQYIYLNQGRKDMYNIIFPENIIKKITNIANIVKPIGRSKVFLSDIQYTEYVGNLNQTPSLGVHFDGGGQSDLLLDYQLSSTLTWGIGIEEEVYELEDNDLLVLTPVSKIHYRPIKNFKKDDVLKMIFFKFSSIDEFFTSKEIDNEKLNKVNDIYNNYYKEDR